MGPDLKPIPGFCGGSVLSRSRGISAQRTVNMRVERNQDPAGTAASPVPIAKSPFALYPRSGKRLFSTLPDNIVGMWSNKSSVFVVTRTSAYQVFEDATFLKLGDVAVGSNPATMRANGTQLLICVAGNAYIATGDSFYQPIVNFASGTVDVTGTDVAWTSGDKFINPGGGSIEVGNLLMLDTALYEVNNVIDDQNLTISVAAGGGTGIPYQAGTTLLYGATCEFIDGYFIVGVPNSKTFRISNLKNGRKWDVLDSAEKSGSVDNIAIVFNIGGNLALLGDTDSTEIWGDSGNADFPFTRISGNTINMGVDAPWSVAKLVDGSICALMYSDAGGGMIVRSNGAEPVRISDHSFENAMRKYSRLDDAIASTYLENGHSFYRIDFPTADRTWEYDSTTGVWVELGISTPDDETYAADHGRFHVHVTWPNNTRMHLAGDYASGKIWQISPDFLDDDGVDFPVMRIAPHINSNLRRITTKAFALDCEMGTIDAAARGADGKPLIPTVNLSYSDNGGRTWEEAGAASLGRVGEYGGTELTAAESFDATASSQTNPQTFNAMPMWNRLGSSFIARTFKIKSTGRQLRAVYNGLVDIE